MNFLNFKYFFFLFLFFCSPFGSWGAFAQNARILSHPASVQLERLNVLNSTFKETNVCVSPDGKYLYFMSTRKSMRISKVRKINGRIEFDGDIWVSQKLNNQWQKPQLVPNINTDDGEDEPNISPSGNAVVYQSWGFRNIMGDNWKELGGPYYISTLNNNVWGKPKGLGGGINSFFVEKERNFMLKFQNNAQNNVISGENDYATDGATMSADGRTFIVAVGEYSGNMDLYISRKDENGKWSFLEKLPLNTAKNERSPVLASDGKTLYFSSDGLGGLGGLDIFKTTLKPDNSNTEIVNVGEPFNSWEDDFGLILTADGNNGYFLREGDIYYAFTKDANKELKPQQVTVMLAGTVKNMYTGEPIMATIQFFDENKKLIANVTTNQVGEYSLILPENITFVSERIEKEGYQLSTGNMAFLQPKAGFNRLEHNPVLIALDPEKNIKKQENKEDKKEEKKEEKKDVVAEIKNNPPKKIRPSECAVQMGEIIILGQKK